MRRTTFALAIAACCFSEAGAQAQDRPEKPEKEIREQLDVVDRPRTPGPAGDTVEGEPGDQPKPDAKSAGRAASVPKGEEAWRKASIEALRSGGQLNAAIAALEKHDIEAAKQTLRVLAQTFGDLYASGPSELVRELDRLDAPREAEARLDYAPLNALMQRYQIYLDPQVTMQVNELQRKYASFRQPREKIADDVANFQIEQIYMRVLAAERALDNGKDLIAMQMLGSLPSIVAEAQMNVPLVPIRLDVRAATRALETNNYDRAKALVTRASDHAAQLLKIAGKDSSLTNRIAPIADHLSAMRKRFESKNRPSADELRRFSHRTQRRPEIASR